MRSGANAVQVQMPLRACLLSFFGCKPAVYGLHRMLYSVDSIAFSVHCAVPDSSRRKRCLQGPEERREQNWSNVVTEYLITHLMWLFPPPHFTRNSSDCVGVQGGSLPALEVISHFWGGLSGTQMTCSGLLPSQTHLKSGTNPPPPPTDTHSCLNGTFYRQFL